MRFLFLGALIGGTALAGPLIQEKESQLDDVIGVKFEAPGELPVLTLPYGKYQANSYDKDNDVYIFKYIRFAQPPLGKLRFRRPVKPEKISGIQNGTVGDSCVQLIPKVGLNLLGDAAFESWAAGVNEILGTMLSKAVDVVNGGSEDCLYLDVYVPGKALKTPGLKLPVVNWIYGGAYTLGAKEQFGLYNPSQMIKQSGGNFIWVAGNYRLGIFGWLAGKTMEEQGDPNVGFYDQRMVLEWIQDFIPHFGGDKNNVVAMGESAGASSILHHLVAFGGKQDPLFKRTIMMSPAFQIMWDRNGVLEQAFKNASRDAGCPFGGIECFREVDTEMLRLSNHMLQDYAPRGSFGVGPSTDGKWLRQLAAVEFLEGNYWKGIDSMLVSHTAQEATIFVDGHIQTDQQFTDFVDRLFPEIARKHGLVKHITDFYPGIDDVNPPYLNETQRVRDFIRDSSFNCNSRYLTEAYKGKTWNMQYNVYPGWHGLDLLATFIAPNNTGVPNAVSKLFKKAYLDIFELYRSYLVSYIVTGDPNPAKPSATKVKGINWPKANTSPAAESQRIGNVLNIDVDGPFLAEDRLMPKLNCDFFQLLEQKGLALAGYSPPGSPPPKFDEKFGTEMPRVTIDNVEPFPANIPPTVPLTTIVEMIVKNNYTIPVSRLEQ